MYDILGLLLLMTDVAQHNYFAKREAFEARRISNYWRYRSFMLGRPLRREIDGLSRPSADAEGLTLAYTLSLGEAVLC
jgi:hypothetical protein